MSRRRVASEARHDPRSFDLSQTAASSVWKRSMCACASIAGGRRYRVKRGATGATSTILCVRVRVVPSASWERVIALTAAGEALLKPANDAGDRHFHGWDVIEKRVRGPLDGHPPETAVGGVMSPLLQ